MKLFISSDIEGTCGINHWDETEIGKPGYDRFAREMTREVRAACDGALSSGYFQNAETDEIRIKDAHDSARNIIPEELPESEMIRLIRGWVTIPGNMMAGVKGCDAAAMTGYHSGAYSAGNNLSHTSNLHNQVIEVNGRRTSEFDLNAMFAAYYGVPTIFLAGDKALCEEAKELIPALTAVPVNEGWGNATVSLQPAIAQQRIREKMREALEQFRRDPKRCLMTLPEQFHVEIDFKDLEKAERGSWYPGAKRVDDKRISYDSSDYFEVTRFLYFTL